MCNRQQMQYSISRTSHCNIQCHGIQEGLTRSDTARQYAVITFFIIFICIFHDQFGSIPEQTFTVFVSCNNCSVSRQGQSDSFIQAVHGIGGEHSGTATASGTSMTLNLSYILIADSRIGRLNHGINQIKMHTAPFSCFHRTTGNKYSRDIQSHGSHEHSRSYLIAIRNTDHRICLMCIHHILHAIGYNVTGRQRIQHSIMPHCNTVIYGNSIKFSGKAS